MAADRFATIVWSLIAFCLALGISDAYACDPCGMHNSVQVPGIMNSLRTTGLRPQAWTLGASEQFSTYRISGENNLRTTESDLELIRNLSTTQVVAGYNISSQTAIQVNAPLVVRNYDHFERYAKVRDTEAGPGDMSVLGTYSPYSYNDIDSRFFIAGMGGLKLPTGDTGSLTRAANADGTSADVRIQGRGLTLGTGSVDIPLGLVAYGRTDRVQIFSSAQYTIRTEGAAGYQFANDLSWSVSPGWLFLIGEEESLSCSIAFSGEYKGSDRVNGEILSRTTTHNLYLGPELFYSLTNRVSVLAAVDLPVAVDVGGAAVKPESRSRLAISWSF